MKTPPSPTPTAAEPALLFGLHDRPPLLQAGTAALAHLLAIVASIATAPWLIAQGLGLSPAHTTYLIASALMVSGLATFIQIQRIGPIGSGLLSIQGTSFAFIGVFIYAGTQLQDMHTNTEVLGTLLGTSAVGGVLCMLVSLNLYRLQRIITSTVAGVVIFLLGLSLVETSINNLQFSAAQASAQQQSAMLVWAQAAVVITAILLLARYGNTWIKLSSICLGLLVGLAFAAATDSLPATTGTPTAVDFNWLQIVPFPLGFDGWVLLLLLPIFLVTITESIGDLTATSALSAQPTRGVDYWTRIRGGVMGDGFNTVLAALCGTFPNTTFSQNNGVIRLTGVASRHVGLWIAAGLLVLGCLPMFSAGFQRLPGGVIHGATALMFAMIMASGWRMLCEQANPRRALTLLAVATVTALGLAQSAWLDTRFHLELPRYVLLLTNFPVTTGALVAIIGELLWRDEQGGDAPHA